MRILFIQAVGIIVLNISVSAQEAPPHMWKAAFRDDDVRQEIWDRLRKDDGEVTAAEVIAENYKLGSHHDGDRQMATAFALVQLNDDPLAALRKMMTEAEPKRRAFAVIVAGILADPRLRPDIERLCKDEARIGQFEGEWFWDTVADAAAESLRSQDEAALVAMLTEEGEKIPDWLTQPNITKKTNKSEMATPRKPSDQF